VWLLGHGTNLLDSIKGGKFAPATPFNRMFKSNEFPRYKSRRNRNQMIRHVSCTKRGNYIRMQSSQLICANHCGTRPHSWVMSQNKWSASYLDRHAITGNMCTHCATRLWSFVTSQNKRSTETRLALHAHVENINSVPNHWRCLISSNRIVWGLKSHLPAQFQGSNCC
jgi:hypothetical protein